MTTWGYKEAIECSEKFIVNNEIIVPIIGATSLFVLKTKSWNDRKAPKDASDLIYVLNNITACEKDDTLYEAIEKYEDIELDDKNPYYEAIFILGNEINENFKEVRKYIINTISPELKLESSKLIGTMVEQEFNFQEKYKQIHQSLSKLIQIIS
ncbi:hypothetical protein [Halobacteriovorax marinus]